ncbi:SGNH/GDSL hydrolase family protein [Frigoribacterium sp. RIT-PI-h]|uniref:SGNH/GDSL hydrolase family protein n=1 Tax=Frigoribacterium sp. RIT-PI-h TaxID=1690245 RepID=UPI0009E6B8C7|nr:SGNH/GDSL hydrolase family protein [Frigoribacterium sp. RIT-PI-h]
MSRNHTTSSTRTIQYACLALFAVAVLLLVYLAANKVAASGPAANAQPGPIPTFGSTDLPAPDNLDKLKSTIAAGGTVTVYALGSSVGVGATLPDPGTQSPSAYLASKLGALTPGGAEVHNLSVNGSVAVEGEQIYRDQIKPNNPTVLLLTYGMNDGMAANFNSGETLPGGIAAIKSISEAARAAGTTVLLATTPSPNVERTDFGLPSGFDVAYPSSGELTPVNPTVDVNGVPFSARHAEWNDALAKTADESGVQLLDVVPSWSLAVQAAGESNLFNPAETVHPNLRGHQSSYWAAIDQFVESF